MDVRSHEQQGVFDVPPSQPDNELQAGGHSDEFVGEADKSRASEQAVTVSSQPPVPQSQTAVQPQPQVSVPVASQPAAQPSSSAMPQIADDTDLIEKEWVDKAKEIVAQTAHDPYLQNKEINKVRADYLKKRYNKNLKQEE